MLGTRSFQGPDALRISSSFYKVSFYSSLFYFSPREKCEEEMTVLGEP